MKHFSYIIASIIISYFFSSCNKVEPIEIEINKPKEENSLDYKKTNHTMTLSWMKEWTTDGSKSSYISSLPDSLDIVIVNFDGDKLNIRQKKDFDNAKSTSAIKTILQVSLDKLITNYTNAIEEVFDLVLFENPDLDEDNVEDIEKIKNLIAEKEKVISDEFYSEITDLVSNRTKIAKSIGFDGISLQVNTLSNKYVRETIENIISNYKKNNNNFIIIFEGDYKQIMSKISNLDYIIGTKDITDIRSINDEFFYLSRFEDFKASKLLLYCSMNDGLWNTPFDDTITSENDPIARIYSIAKWRSEEGYAVGFALRVNDMDIRNGYPVLRECIQYVSHK